VLGLTLHRALAYANQRNHEYATLEHLLLALIDDADASALMRACKADLGALKEDLVSYIDSELKELVINDSRDPRPTPGFQRVVQRAVLRAQNLGRDATGANVVGAIFDERESHAAWFLSNQDMTKTLQTPFCTRSSEQVKTPGLARVRRSSFHSCENVCQSL
jgi:ATP-dependent Clp protease ATP-binding subunit ClpA